ncbi:hypothetical protein NFI96_021181, partial [Prochilodus magdalenae]
SLQEIQAFVGDSVILPCSNSNPALQSRPTVFWRYRDSGTVYDIIDGQEQLSEQEESYKKRVQSFPDQWKKGNFSIRFSKLKKADEGQYTCFIPSLGVETKLSLTVKGAYDLFVSVLVCTLTGVRRDCTEIKSRDVGGPKQDQCTGIISNGVLTSRRSSTFTSVDFTQNIAIHPHPQTHPRSSSPNPTNRGLMACVLLMLMNKASLDQTVEAVEGSSVTLPCYIASADVPTCAEELNIFWRYNDKKKVFDIVSGYFLENRDPAFRNRTDGFGHDTYLKGNFSIELSDVRASDQGEYSCFMYFADITQKVQLQVK